MITKQTLTPIKQKLVDIRTQTESVLIFKIILQYLLINLDGARCTYGTSMSKRKNFNLQRELNRSRIVRYLIH